jgi:hypothetical protein
MVSRPRPLGPPPHKPPRSPKAYYPSSYYGTNYGANYGTPYAYPQAPVPMAMTPMPTGVPMQPYYYPATVSAAKTALTPVSVPALRVSEKAADRIAQPPS